MAKILVVVVESKTQPVSPKVFQQYLISLYPMLIVVWRACKGRDTSALFLSLLCSGGAVCASALQRHNSSTSFSTTITRFTSDLIALLSCTLLVHILALLSSWYEDKLCDSLSSDLIVIAMKSDNIFLQLKKIVFSRCHCEVTDL